MPISFENIWNCREFRSQSKGREVGGASKGRDFAGGVKFIARMGRLGCR
ncbi:hypothetical protein HMPREF9440_00557 [Sutterella parvirubra YIT 11816]|uniref:Uncharacterized protein n=1 Tax=Sutterella parvirubra YIT 11816 TaxID=762967 RepID=H3KCV3_9BURK|nr:hypothetical protein HMPREF9440_00557 [Sutterella parvirubra YIT 11816]